ncbi:hypothetical protein QOT17_017401 [Balamuthia mandrillaris]
MSYGGGAGSSGSSSSGGGGGGGAMAARPASFTPYSDMPSVMKNLETGTLLFKVIRAEGLRLPHAYVVIGTYTSNSRTSNLNKARAPSPSIGRTNIIYNTKNPAFTERIDLRVNKKVLRDTLGVKVQVWSYTMFGFDHFLGELLFDWNQVAQLTNIPGFPQPEERMDLQPRKGKVKEDDKLVQGSLVFNIKFRKTEPDDFHPHHV